MARKCYVTGLGSKAGNNRSHSLQATRRTFKANLQKVTVKKENGSTSKEYVCTRCLKSGKVERA